MLTTGPGPGPILIASVLLMRFIMRMSIHTDRASRRDWPVLTHGLQFGDLVPPLHRRLQPEAPDHRPRNIGAGEGQTGTRRGCGGRRGRAVIAVVDSVGSKGIVTIVVATAMPPVEVLLAPSFE